MWRPVVVTAAPAGEPLTLEKAKAHLRVDHDDDNTQIGDYIASARDHIEGVTGTRLVTQTVSLKTDCWADLANLPACPLQDVSTIAYLDTAGDVITLSPSVYETRLDLLEPCVVLKPGQAWPPLQQGSLITVTAIAGYGAASSQPAAVLAALRMVLTDLYEQRGTEGSTAVVTAPVAATVENLLCNHRKHLI
jgi:uncharacterized phiE125 gp8 family phage protein